MATNEISPATLISIERSFESSSFLDEFQSELSKHLIAQFAQHLIAQSSGEKVEQVEQGEKEAVDGSYNPTQMVRLGLASLGAFLQANVTGPVLEGFEPTEAVFVSALASSKSSTGPENGLEVASTLSPIASLRRLCLRSLDVDGVSPYPYIPHIELFCLSRFVFTSGKVLPTELPEIWSDPRQSLSLHLSWTRLRIHLWHYKLITQPSLGPGSLFTKGGLWTDVPTLQELIEKSLLEAETSISGPVKADEDSQWPQEARVQFYLEVAMCHILLGEDAKARTALQSATETSRFSYALSGALGKRTRFQENNISQLVVLAKSLALSDTNHQPSSDAAPVALPLNDDTLLEKIKFDNDQANAQTSSIPTELQDLTPEDQPQLRPEDQIILLTEATLRDTFSPADSLTAEEILPFAVRVIDDKSTNWQVYTQALLVRSRIELNRSRTLERAVLQMQALVDQVIVDTQASTNSATKSLNGQEEPAAESKIPSIQITPENQLGHSTNLQKPTSFLPAPKPSESASPQERLRYANALSSPPRWHLESELAYAWTAVGSIVSALEIFKRLRLWPEVALCLASAAGADDQDGRGSGGEDKARAIVRWRLFNRTSTLNNITNTEDESDLDNTEFDVSSLKAADFCGPERSPPPPNAPRLFCILGDIENDPQHYQRAWKISNRRFARAQRSLGELHLRKQEWKEARDAYKLAVSVNRLSPEMWNRLGDIELRLGNFPDAAEAFQRAVSTANNTSGGDDARTWSNMGTALLSWYRQIVREQKDHQEKLKNDEDDADILGGMVNTQRAAELGKPAHKLLQDALIAFKRGATLADTNWRIWDNVITLAASLSPKPDLDDVVLGLRNVMRIRKTEEALDVDILTLLVREATKTPPVTSDSEGGNDSVYEPPRGTLESKVITLFEDEVAPLITTNSACWSLVSRLRAWRHDWTGALDAAEKAWRAAVGGGVSSSLSASSGAQDQQGNWLVNAEAWDTVAQRTSELVAAYENYGARLESIGGRWKGKARSAVRSVMSKAKEPWEGDERWLMLSGMMEDLKA
ncbi:hypothetical protein F4821DRAFT_235514 [Hypoxylon rubiginosum]|uniref:Uncharacterized protein n=1 Tax=Hypoxylon rubiginosum TaxID=110542 RepID=A0ACC0D5J7_9PEZI|nr:hypothetical protein F4821DRAFT_235514 [Hypoxylon rubiginosum]